MLTKRSNLLRIAMLAVTLSLMVSSSPTTSAEKSGGVWVPSTAGCPSTNGLGTCGENQVCADWDVDGEVLLNCCIEAEFLSTSLFSACS